VCAISSLTSTFAISSPDEFLFELFLNVLYSIFVVVECYVNISRVRNKRNCSVKL